MIYVDENFVLLIRHMKRRYADTLVRKCENLNLETHEEAGEGRKSNRKKMIMIR